MEVKGKIIVVLPPQSGTSQAGNAWKKQEYVLETFDAYPRKVHFDFFGDRADQYPLALGDVVNLSFDIESREYNGRWYTEVRAWRINRKSAAEPQPMTTDNLPPLDTFSTEESESSSASEVDDLPF